MLGSSTSITVSISSFVMCRMRMTSWALLARRASRNCCFSCLSGTCLALSSSINSGKERPRSADPDWTRNLLDTAHRRPEAKTPMATRNMWTAQGHTREAFKVGEGGQQQSRSERGENSPGAHLGWIKIERRAGGAGELAGLRSRGGTDRPSGSCWINLRLSGSESLSPNRNSRLEHVQLRPSQQIPAAKGAAKGRQPLVQASSLALLAPGGCFRAN